MFSFMLPNTNHYVTTSATNASLNHLLLKGIEA